MNESSPEVVIRDLAYALHYCFWTIKERNSTASAAWFADKWVEFVVGALDGVCISHIAGNDRLSRPLPFAGTHRIEAEAFYAARSGMRGGGNIDVLFQLWCDTEDRWSTYGTPLVFQSMTNFEPLDHQTWTELKERSARLTLATPCGRLVFVGNNTGVPRHLGEEMEHPDWFRVSDMVSFSGSRKPPAARDGRQLMPFCVDLASGWVGDPALSGATTNPIMDEVLTNFHVAHVLRLKIVRDDSPANWKPPPSLQ